ncbi:MAG: hypothetical protein JRE07_04430 [Deltaproteobacteria bacterium]|nr:hypothetical protein [Deltaproteobacteria bacterium]
MLIAVLAVFTAACSTAGTRYNTQKRAAIGRENVRRKIDRSPGNTGGSHFPRYTVVSADDQSCTVEYLEYESLRWMKFTG